VKWLPFVACYFISRGRGFFSLFSLSFFSSLGASFFGCFQPGRFFQMPFPSLCFVGALYVAWVFLTWVYFCLPPRLFSVRTFFFFLPHHDCACAYMCELELELLAGLVIQASPCGAKAVAVGRSWVGMLCEFGANAVSHRKLPRGNFLLSFGVKVR
jgi:hypothetical protein